MIQAIDYFLDRITMYRLVLYILIIFLTVAAVFSMLHILPYNPVALILSVGTLLIITSITNVIFSYTFNAPTNIESVYITALILACIFSPVRSVHDLPLYGWVAVWAMASKYIFALKKKHIFNPVAIAAVITAYFLHYSATWWIGTSTMVPFVILGGLLIIRKLRKGALVGSFSFTSLAVTIIMSVFHGGGVVMTMQQVLFQSSFFFFAFLMLTEPLTVPPTKNLQIVYGGLVGILFSPQFHIGTFSLTPEQALIIGNIFSYIVSPKQKLMLNLQEKVQAATGVVDFLFSSKEKLLFTPGQYMEWTLPHRKSDSRGNRRYFTIASSPTENNIRLGVKFYEKGSSYKKALLTMSNGAVITGGQLAGDFVLPKNQNQKLVFMSGGIGATPFRSILKYLIDMKQKRPIIHLYSNKNASEIAYIDVWNQAYQELEIPTEYTLTDTKNIPFGWRGRVGRFDQTTIQEIVPDFMERTFYLSGPHVMVTEFHKTLRNMGVKEENIKEDFFPGLT